MKRAAKVIHLMAIEEMIGEEAVNVMGKEERMKWMCIILTILTS